ncbi:MAG: hypothetical protein ACE5IG_07525 [Dehalococcoidia bacterium]
MNREQRYELLVQLRIAEDRLLSERANLMVVANAVLFAGLNIEAIRGAVVALGIGASLLFMYTGLSLMAALSFYTDEIFSMEKTSMELNGIFRLKEEELYNRQRFWQRGPRRVSPYLGVLFPLAFLVAWCVVTGVLVF